MMVVVFRYRRGTYRTALTLATRAAITGTALSAATSAHFGVFVLHRRRCKGKEEGRVKLFCIFEGADLIVGRLIEMDRVEV